VNTGRGGIKKMKSFHNVFGIIFIGIILVVGASLGRTQEAAKEKTREETREEERLQERERLRDKERIIENESKILGKYAERFGVDIDTLADLRAKRLGYGEITHALVLSEMAEKPLDEIVAMRDAGKGWGQIADECGVKLGKVRREVRREHRRIRRELTREERRALRHSWEERRERAREVGSPQPRHEEKEKPGKEYAPPERGGGKGGGRGGGR
jgi:hypothetical protein